MLFHDLYELFYGLSHMIIRETANCEYKCYTLASYDSPFLQPTKNGLLDDIIPNEWLGFNKKQPIRRVKNASYAHFFSFLNFIKMLSATRDAVRLKTAHISREITVDILIKVLYAPNIIEYFSLYDIFQHTFKISFISDTLGSIGS